MVIDLRRRKTRSIENLYKDFHIPLSELRQVWHRAIYEIKDGFCAFNSETDALRWHVDLRKKEHVENKLFNLTRPKAQKDISSIIGEGVHTSLRKYSVSKPASTAWHAIKDMPDGEWEYICDVVAYNIQEYLK